MSYYNESISFSPLKKSLIELAKLQLSRGDLSSAQNLATTMIKLDISASETALLLAEISYLKNSIAESIYHYKQILDLNKHDYDAFKSLIEMLNKSGNLAQANTFFQEYDGTGYPGYHFCKGLYNKFVNNPNEALNEFNICRRDYKWGKEAIYNMVRIFLNPDGETMGGNVMSSEDEENNQIVSTCTRLLNQVDPDSTFIETKILHAYVIMSTKSKNDIERGLEKFLEIITKQGEYIPALMGSAVGYMLLKQTPKARNQLKRISKIEFNSEFASDYETCWLLLSDIYIESGKFDMAMQLIKEVVKYNQSCAKAWEYLGFIMEKEASYKDAAVYYEKAWKLQEKNNLNVAYKLAFNYLKASRYVDAVDVCLDVLAKEPEFPKIRKEILDKARLELRK